MRSATRVAIATAVVAVLALAAAQVVRGRTRVPLEAAPICRVSTADRVVALSFDDGPDPAHTASVVAMLERTGARATFFVIGERAAAHPNLIEDIRRHGNELGDHTWSHPHLDDLDGEQALEEVIRGAGAVSPRPALFRAPYGVASGEMFEAVRERGFLAIHWSVALDPLVSDARSPDDAARAVFASIAPGDIVLAHDADDGAISRGRAIETVALLLPVLRDAGYEVVTVSDLLTRGEPVRATPRPWFWQSGFECPRD